MTRKEAIKLLVNATYSDEWQGNEDLTAAHNMAIEALEMVEEFEKAQIITGGRLNGRTYAYKCGLEDGKRKALEKEKYYKDLAQSYERTIVQLTEAIAEQQPVIAAQRWIPVSERLPKEFEFVNCTCHSLIDDREDWVVETVYIPQPSDSPYSDWGNIPMLNSGDCEVVAWVHRDIPEPYKAEMESGE